MAKKRNKLEIIKDILLIIRQKSGRIKPTHILYKSNLSHQMMTEYLKELIGKELITEKKIENSRTYLITDKGIKYLEKYSMISDFMDSFGLD